jgi:spermidine/putrescine transport system permease protein
VSARMVKRIVVLGVYLFLYVPILVLIAQSFNASKYGTRWAGFTFKWYRELADSRMLIEAAGNTALVAVLSATLATLLGTLAAIAIFRYRFTGRRVLQGLLFVGIMTPDIVIAISLLVLFIALHLALGFGTLLMAHMTFCVPFVTLTVASRLEGFDPRMIEAALDLGAGEWQVVRRIILPLTVPGMAAGWLLSFTLSVDDVIVSFFTTGPSFEVLPLRIYSMVRLGVKPEVNALATILFLLPLVLVTMSHFLVREVKK